MNDRNKRNKMNKMNKRDQVQADEIDLFELFQTLWVGKWLISKFIVITVLLGGSLIFFSNSVYESKISYSVDTIPPFYSDVKVLTDFKKKFYSESIFKSWKKSNSNNLLEFEDFSTTKLVNGFVFSKNKSQQMALVDQKNKGTSYIIINTVQYSILDDFFNYAEHVSELLKAEHVNRAKNELHIIETRFKDFSTANDAIISQILEVDRYIVSVEKGGANVLEIKRPTLPQKTSSNSFQILALSIILGGLIGVTYVLISNATRKRKDKLAKG